MKETSFSETSIYSYFLRKQLQNVFNQNEGINRKRERQGVQAKRETTVQQAKRTPPSADWSRSMGDSRVRVPREKYVIDIIL